MPKDAQNCLHNAENEPLHIRPSDANVEFCCDTSFEPLQKTVVGSATSRHPILRRCYIQHRSLEQNLAVFRRLLSVVGIAPLKEGEPLPPYPTEKVTKAVQETGSKTLDVLLSHHSAQPCHNSALEASRQLIDQRELSRKC